MRLPLVLALLAAAPLAAQPQGQAVVDAWRAGWDRAAQGVAAVRADEQSTRTVEGPRGPVTVEVVAAVRYPRGGGPERSAERVRVDGREVDPGQARRQGRRLGRAFGPDGRAATAPPPLPDRVVVQAAPGGAAETTWDGAPAWRVSLAGGRAQAWFTRSPAAPRLLAVRAEGRRRGLRAAREVRYARVDGLDLPASAAAEVTARQRRRLRDYVVTLTATAAYSDHRVERE